MNTYGFRDVVGYEGLYGITSCGKVWNYKKGRFLKPTADKDGYLKVGLRKNGKTKTFLVHRLVAMAYIANPEGLPEVNHKDEVKDHDWLNNLEWCDREYNVNYGTRNEKVSKALKGNENLSCRKGVYCVELDKTFKSMSEAAIKTGVWQADISKACNGKRRTAGGYHWLLVNEVA